MKKRLVLKMMLFMSCAIYGQVGVNIITPHSTAAMQVESPAGAMKGMLTPSMTSVNRISISTGTNVPADGLIVYDVTHKMHYYYQASSSRWVSMSPLVLSTPGSGSGLNPAGAITTPGPLNFSVGINKQNPVQALDVVGNTTVSGNSSVGGNLIVAGAFSASGYPVNPFVPAGTIVMWSGNVIPAGWAECNGGNGTPDLRGRFIVAAGQAASTTVPGDLNPNYAPNSTGGENNHVLSPAEIPKHFHEANGDGATIAASGGAHYHTADPNGQGLNAQRSSGNSGGLASDSPATINTSSNTHSHPNNEFSGRVGDGSSAGLNNQPHENRPQFYVLRFIMKL